MHAETNQRPINPFYAQRNRRSRAVDSSAEPDAVRVARARDGNRRSHSPIRYAKLPRSPLTGSPVPHLTSLYHFEQTGGFGDRGYPGNCGGLLIRDLLQFYQPRRVFDPMSGSGTCSQVCESLQIPCVAGDIHEGFDAADPTMPSRFGPQERFDFVWAHPPYWRQKLYAADERDLSRTPTLAAFLNRYAAFIENCAQLLTPRGKLAILMGDYCDREIGFVPLTYYTKRLAFQCGLRQACCDIIRFGHGASSGRKVYRSAFIPNLHDVCMVFERA